MAQLAKRLRLYLSNAFTRNVELLADFFQRVVRIHVDAKAHAQYFRLARRQAGQDRVRGLFKS